MKTNKTYLKMIRACLFLLGLVLFSLQSHATQNIPVLEDSYVRSGNPANNYGASNEMNLRHEQNDAVRYSYLKFEIPAEYSGKEFTAILRLYFYNNNGTGTAPIKLVRTSNDWSESTLNWNNKPVDDATSAVVDVSILNGLAASEVDIDVSALFNGLTGNTITIKLQLAGQFPDNIKIATKEETEAGRTKPQLILELKGTTPPDAPNTPLNLTVVTTTFNSVELAWEDASDNEESFLVQRSNSETGPFNQIASVAANTASYTDVNRMLNRTYYYRVVASNSSGNSNPSNVVAGTTVALDDCNWTFMSNENVTFEVSGQVIRYGAGNNWVAKEFDGTVTCNNGGFMGYDPAPGVAKTCQICREAATEAPAAPSNLVVSGGTPSSITLTWESNSTTEDGFKIERKVAGSDEFTQTYTVPFGITSFTNDKLLMGRTYTYRVFAYNSKGNSAPTNEVTGSTDGFIACDWSEKYNENELLEFTEPRTIRFGAEGNYIVVIADRFLCSYTSLGDFDPAPGKVKHCYVCELSSPKVPENLTVVATTYNSVELKWDDVSGNEEFFIVQRSNSQEGPFTQIASLAANTTTYTDINRMINRTYYYRVLARNSEGDSDPSTVVSGTTTSLDDCNWSYISGENATFVVSGEVVRYGAGDNWVAKEFDGTVNCNNNGFAGYDPAPGVVKQCEVCRAEVTSPPAAPSNLVVSGSTASSITISWVSNSDNEDGFRIERKAHGSNEFTETFTAPFGSTSFTDTKLLMYSTYTYRVFAFNELGESLKTNEVTGSTHDLIACDWTGTYNENDLLEFEEPRTIRFGANGKFIVAVADTFLCSYTSFGGFDPAPGVVKQCYVCEESVPSAPANLIVNVISFSQLDLAWNGDDRTEGFIIMRKSDADYATIDTVASDVKNYNDMGLIHSTTYIYKLMAYNYIGNSEESTEVSGTTLADDTSTDIYSTKGISVYPNPLREAELKIVLDHQLTDGFLSIIGTDGRIVLEKKIQGNQVYIQHSDLPQGLLLIKIVSDKKIYISKFLVK